MYLKGDQLKVLHVIPSVGLHSGGPTKAIISIEKILTSKGVEITTVTTNDAGPGLRNEKPRGVPLNENSVTRWYFNKTLDPYKVSIGFWKWIHVHAKDYDIIHIHAVFSFMSTVASRAAKKAGVPYIVRPLGTLNRYGMEKRRPFFKRLSFALVESSIVSNARAIHCTSVAEKEDVESLGVASRCVVIPLGIDSIDQNDQAVKLFVETYPKLQGSNYLLYLSRIDKKKNIESLLQAFHLIHQQEPSLKLVIAGDGDPSYVSGLKKLTNELGVEESVCWVGHITGELKQGAFLGASSFVLPSFSENFGIAVAEALMVGLPCILCKGVAIAEDVVESGAGITVDVDGESIAKGILHIANNPSISVSMSKSAKKLALEKFSVNTMGKRLVDLYNDIDSKSLKRA